MPRSSMGNGVCGKGCAEESEKGVQREGVSETLWGMEDENERGGRASQAFMCTFCTCDVIPTKIRGGGDQKGGK
jgi:hypothetical protein